VQISRQMLQPLRKWANAHRVALGLFSNFNLIFIVWQSVSSSAADILATSLGTLCLVNLATMALHVALLAMNTCLCW
jgi:hypothetical protein